MQSDYLPSCPTVAGGGVSDLENFLTDCERKSLAHSRRQSDIYFDEIESLEDEIEQTKDAHRRHSDIIEALLQNAIQRKREHLAEIEAGLADLAVRIGK